MFLRFAIALLIASAAMLASGLLTSVRSATRPSVAQIEIYSRGWVDGAAPPGVFAISSTCSAARVCTVKTNDGGCVRATVTSYAFPGPWSRCSKQKKGPKS